MLFYTVGQWRVFMTMMYAGMLAGLWYGGLARMARFLEAGAWLNAFFDVLIAAGIWLIVGAGLLVANYGEVRAYALLGALVGFVLYRLTVGRLLGFLLDKGAKWLVWAVRWIANRSITKKIFQ